MAAISRSACPINLSLEVFGDKWSLIILRDMIFGGRRHFRDLLTNSMEGIASNILADRMKHLVEMGLLTKAPDPSHKQKAIYSLTEMAIELVPIMALLGRWGSKWLPVSDTLSARALRLAQGGPEMAESFMAELRQDHLGIPAAPPPNGRTVRQILQDAYTEALASSPVSA